LNQQLKQIQEELGTNPSKDDIELKRKRGLKKKWSKSVKETFDKELKKLERMNPQSAEYSVQTNYVELLLDLPWNHYSDDDFNLKHAQEILDRDHYGLEKVKSASLNTLLF